MTTCEEVGCRDCVEPQTEAVKFDDGKLAYDLVPAAALEELVKVYTFGAKKYARRNWEKGFPWCRVFAAIMRHAWSWMRGQDKDPESGLHHMAHAAFGCLALVEFSYTKAGKDDRKEAEEVLTKHEVAEMFPVPE